METEKLAKLFGSLQQRWRPEDVLVEVGAQKRPTHQQHVLSSMKREFAGAIWPTQQVNSASALFNLEAPVEGDAGALTEFAKDCVALIGGANGDFKSGRLDAGARHEFNVLSRFGRAQIPLGHRAYNKRFRVATKLVEKAERYAKIGRQKQLAQIAKSSLACVLPYEEFAKDHLTAIFVAYLTATLNRRSEFTFESQKRAFDEVCAGLFAKLEMSNTTNWLAVAHVYPNDGVLSRLTNEQRGKLIGTWYQVMVETATTLKRLAETQDLNLEQLIVKKGNDSSTWNESAGAFNKARDGWISALYSMGWETILDRFCPGKALRLMAADVAFVHRHHLSGLEPDTAVWGKLARPWSVVLDGYPQNRASIEQACQIFGIEGKGWVKPRSKTVAPFETTPELVHGVTVSSPKFAEVLKKAGFFAGPSKLKPSAPMWY